jgi:iron complex transport system substrate-binding protein
MKKRIYIGLGLAGLIALIILAWQVEPLRGTPRELQVSTRPAPDTGHPERIVSLAPSITEVLFALGLDSEIVGVTEHCNYPEKALSRPKVGSFITGDVERIITMNPDLIIATRDGNSEHTISLLEELGFPIATYQPSTLEEVLDQILVLGRVTGREDRARSIVQEYRGKMALVKERVRGAQVVSVLFAYGRYPLILAGRLTFADDMIRLAGGRNIAADSRIPYPHFSLEEVLARGPEVIIDVSMGSDASAQRAAEKHWSRWPEIPAVKAHRIYVLDQDLLARPGPRLFEGLLMLAKSLHPERFPEESRP